MFEGERQASAAPDPRRCPWCSVVVADDAVKCQSCGAAVAQRESLGEMHIPGVTTVDPNMRAERSVLQGVMRVQAAGNRAAMVGATGMLPGIPQVGLLMDAALVSPELVAGAKYAGGLVLDGTQRHNTSRIGEPSELARLAASRLDQEVRPASPEIGISPWEKEDR